jgi:hypothetical protein
VYDAIDHSSCGRKCHLYGEAEVMLNNVVCTVEQSVLFVSSILPNCYVMQYELCITCMCGRAPGRAAVNI